MASFIGLAAVTGSDITIDGAAPGDLLAVLPAFERLGVKVGVGRRLIHVPAGQELVIQDDLGGQIPKIEDGIWPAFLSDSDSIAVVVATQAHGTILVFEKMFENRLFFVDKLVGMGARIIIWRFAPRRRLRACEALRRAAGEPGHPRGHGDAHREPLCRRACRPSATSRRSTGATSGSTSGCARSSAN